MLSDYFYNATTKKAVAVFGTLFNNINTERLGIGEEVLQHSKIPLSYGPRSKFLERIRSQADLTDPKLALKLPRMSFELDSIGLDTAKQLNPLNKLTTRTGDTVSVQNQSIPYILGFTLSVYGKNSDDILQIVEQILPYFTPEYVVTAKDLEYPGSRTDVPIILSGVNPSDDYEGSFDTNRVSIYTLSFTMRIPYVRKKTPNQKVILQVDVNYFDKLRELGLEPVESISYIADSQSDTTIEIEYTP